MLDKPTVGPDPSRASEAPARERHGDDRRAAVDAHSGSSARCVGVSSRT
jgi:hypothetical protein